MVEWGLKHGLIPLRGSKSGGCGLSWEGARCKLRCLGIVVGHHLLRNCCKVGKARSGGRAMTRHETAICGLVTEDREAVGTSISVGRGLRVGCGVGGWRQSRAGLVWVGSGADLGWAGWGGAGVGCSIGNMS